MAGVGLYIGPPSNSVKFCPETLTAVTIGDCAVIFAFSKTEQYNVAASFAWPLNQRQGVIFSFMLINLIQTYDPIKPGNRIKTTLFIFIF